VDRAIRFLEQPGEQPFFLFLHLFDIHYDYQPPEQDWRRFDPDYDGTLTGFNFTTNQAINADMDPRDLEHLLALYDGEIRFTDRHVGRLVDAVERLGLLDETLILVTSDHGDEFFEHGRKAHTKTLYEEVLHVPLLAYGGGVARNVRHPDVVRHIDMMPTILEAVGLPVPQNVLGESVAPLVWSSRNNGGEAVDGERLATSRLTKYQDLASVRSRTWKVICDLRDQSVAGHLFDLVEDPFEQSPVETPAAQEKIRDIRRNLAGLTRLELVLRQSVAGDDTLDALDELDELPDNLEEQLRQLGYIR